ncbi:N-acetylglucosamine kinase [Acaricomes phytoseiuli]|uniref:N-acetylglucosamine kinase n=1 Tax=Acaricomes phytoseiuli TaxID=291968 RepID=UPI0003655720|nr:BadF/BadG/BcrA/BcrD ATPase family protein [Acaricomes phytoseiuli]
MPFFLAIDAGGSSTRATLVDHRGTCWGTGRAGPGNPVSSGAEKASHGHYEAIRYALHAAEPDSPEIAGLLIAMAGGSTRHSTGDFPEQLSARLLGLGLQLKPMIESDLLATYFSGTCQLHGYALAVGTGAVAASIDGGALHRASDGLGWLLGDHGSGFWLGREAVRAAAADLDGGHRVTALTTAVLEHFGLISVPLTRASSDSRPAALQELLAAAYAIQPVELAQLAPAVFTTARAGDRVATTLLAEAGQLLLQTLSAVRPGDDEKSPVVLGGSILNAESSLLSSLLEAMPATTPVIRVHNGLAGAASMVLRQAGISVDEQILNRITDSLKKL